MTAPLPFPSDRLDAMLHDLRARGEPTLPSTIALEREINPFLRTRVPEVVAAAAAFKGARADDEAGVFAAIREWKNEFR